MKQYQRSVVPQLKKPCQTHINWKSRNSVIKFPSSDPHFRDRRQKEAKTRIELRCTKLQHFYCIASKNQLTHMDLWAINPIRSNYRVLTINLVTAKNKFDHEKINTEYEIRWLLIRGLDYQITENRPPKSGVTYIFQRRKASVTREN